MYDTEWVELFKQRGKTEIFGYVKANKFKILLLRGSVIHGKQQPNFQFLLWLFGAHQYQFI